MGFLLERVLCKEFNKELRLKLSHKEVLNLLGEKDSLQYTILPRDPSKKVVTVENGFLADRAQRRYLTTLWKHKRDPRAYKEAVEYFIRASDESTQALDIVV